MREEKLNEKLIRFEIQGICQDCIYLNKIVPIIREMLSEEYKTGLEQARFDKRMLELENDTLRKDLQKSKKIIDIILEYGIYMDECPLNFSFDENSIQDKAQNVFYEDNGEYCENNCNDCYKKCWLKFFKEMQRLKEIK